MYDDQPLCLDTWDVERLCNACHVERLCNAWPSNIPRWCVCVYLVFIFIYFCQTLNTQNTYPTSHTHNIDYSVSCMQKHPVNTLLQPLSLPSWRSDSTLAQISFTVVSWNGKHATQGVARVNYSTKKLF